MNFKSYLMVMCLIIKYDGKYLSVVIILMNQHQLDTPFLVCLLRVNASTCFGRFYRNLHAVNTHPTHEITPNNICVEPPEDGRVTPETCNNTYTKESVSCWC
jgi:hypothetical protein